MDAMGLDAGVRRRGNVAVVDLRGEVSGGAEAVLAAAYAEAAVGSPAAVLLNFGEVSYVNSTGIAVIVGLLARARRDRREIRACGLSEHYREIFEITRLSDFVRICADEESAVGAGVGADERSVGAAATRREVSDV